MVHQFTDTCAFACLFVYRSKYAATEKLSVSLGMHYYFDKSVNYGKSVDGTPVSNST